jgi:hypothetical protein
MSLPRFRHGPEIDPERQICYQPSMDRIIPSIASSMMMPLSIMEADLFGM